MRAPRRSRSGAAPVVSDVQSRTIRERRVENWKAEVDEVAELAAAYLAEKGRDDPAHKARLSKRWTVFWEAIERAAAARQEITAPITGRDIEAIERRSLYAPSEVERG